MAFLLLDRFSLAPFSAVGRGWVGAFAHAHFDSLTARHAAVGEWGPSRPLTVY